MLRRTEDSSITAALSATAVSHGGVVKDIIAAWESHFGGFGNLDLALADGGAPDSGICFPAFVAKLVSSGQWHIVAFPMSAKFAPDCDMYLVRQKFFLKTRADRAMAKAWRTQHATLQRVAGEQVTASGMHERLSGGARHGGDHLDSLGNGICRSPLKSPGRWPMACQLQFISAADSQLRESLANSMWGTTWNSG